MNEVQLLKQGAEKLNITLTDQQVDQFMTYMDMLIQWNKNINLTAITETEDIIKKHFLDCLSVSQMEAFQVDGHLIDIGTGAGFPGLPLKIVYPQLKVTLVDSLNKRIGFLNAVIEKLGLEDIHCIHSRAEDLGKDEQHREQYDMCVSRAVAHLAVLCEYCLPFIKVGGKFYSFKGQDIQEEKDESKKAINLLGGEIELIQDTPIPYSDIVHNMIQIGKIGPTPKRYPRKAGKPTKSPIGI